MKSSSLASRRSPRSQFIFIKRSVMLRDMRNDTSKMIADCDFTISQTRARGVQGPLLASVWVYRATCTHRVYVATARYRPPPYSRITCILYCRFHDPAPLAMRVADCFLAKSKLPHPSPHDMRNVILSFHPGECPRGISGRHKYMNRENERVVRTASG